MEVEEFVPYIIIPTKFKQPPKPPPKPTKPNPGTTHTVPVQATPSTRPVEVQTTESFQWSWNGQGTVSRVTQTEAIVFNIAEERFRQTKEQTHTIIPSYTPQEHALITHNINRNNPRLQQQKQKRKKQTDTSESDPHPHKRYHEEYIRPPPSVLDTVLHTDFPSSDSGSDYAAIGSGSETDSG